MVIQLWPIQLWRCGYIVVAFTVVAYIIMAYIAMAYIVVAYITMTYVVMALYSYGLYSYGLYSYGLYSHGLYLRNDARHSPSLRSTTSLAKLLTPKKRHDAASLVRQRRIFGARKCTVNIFWMAAVVPRPVPCVCVDECVGMRTRTASGVCQGTVGKPSSRRF